MIETLKAWIIIAIAWLMDPEQHKPDEGEHDLMVEW